jgi:hypothetical protein
LFGVMGRSYEMYFTSFGLFAQNNGHGYGMGRQAPQFNYIECIKESFDQCGQSRGLMVMISRSQLSNFSEMVPGSIPGATILFE